MELFLGAKALQYRTTFLSGLQTESTEQPCGDGQLSNLSFSSLHTKKEASP